MQDIGDFDTDYIIFRNVDNSEKIIMNENKEFDKIFENIYHLLKWNPQI